MIGAIIWELRAENKGQLRFINGRLMHAVFFKILNEFSLKLGSFVHNEMNIKPFTISFLEPANKISHINERWQVRNGDKFLWRVTALNKNILQAILNVQVGKIIKVGNLNLRLEKIICDGNIRADSGIVGIDDFISSVKNFPAIKEVGLHFVSPVSFRIDDFDAPYPRAELIFSSLVDKWIQAEMPASVDKKLIRELAGQIRLTCWRGESKKIYPSQDRGVSAFWGKFFYNVESLSNDVQKVFILLVKFGEFAGVGRLTGQGFGQMRASFL